MKPDKGERQAKILAALAGAPSLRVQELAQALRVSTETIRRDLDELTQAGLLNRTYGGAVRPLSTEPGLLERHAQLAPEKARIAAATLPLLAGARVLLMGGGATTTHIAQHIAIRMHDLMVVTHSVSVANALAGNPSIKVLMIPGLFNPSEGCTTGGHAVAFLQNLYADFTLLGASGLDTDGVTDALPEVAAVYVTMLARSAGNIIAADSSKFGHVFVARFAQWRQVGTLVTDAPPQGELSRALDKAKVRLLVT